MHSVDLVNGVAQWQGEPPSPASAAVAAMPAPWAVDSAGHAAMRTQACLSRPVRPS
ncbi:hypothetical protein [Saccharopolyspora sp. 5N708]|uniref:hypothetical protein n=1 Tax=Saccharopolyspora sp. 5N708 TaxID=3457424 RepID=UPI003FD2F505